MLPRRFALVRHVDYTGVSGIGVVAYGVAFADGQVVLRWCSAHPATSMWATMDDLLAVHGHGEATSVEWIDAPHGDVESVPPKSRRGRRARRARLTEVTATGSGSASAEGDPAASSQPATEPTTEPTTSSPAAPPPPAPEPPAAVESAPAQAAPAPDPRQASATTNAALGEPNPPVEQAASTDEPWARADQSDSTSDPAATDTPDAENADSSPADQTASAQDLPERSRAASRSDQKPAAERAPEYGAEPPARDRPENADTPPPSPLPRRPVRPPSTGESIFDSVYGQPLLSKPTERRPVPPAQDPGYRNGHAYIDTAPLLFGPLTDDQLAADDPDDTGGFDDQPGDHRGRRSGRHRRRDPFA